MTDIGKDDGPTVASDRATRDQGTADSVDSGPGKTASQAPVIDAVDQCALDYLERLHAGAAEPGELSAVLAYMIEDALHHACRRIERALGVKHA